MNPLAREQGTMEKWRETWRKGVAPLLSVKALEALREALATDDARLIQGNTTMGAGDPDGPSDPTMVGACALGFCGWQGEGLKTAALVEEFFGNLCFMIDSRFREHAGCRRFLNWFDEAPRDEMRAALLPEVDLALQQRTKETEVLPS